MVFMSVDDIGEAIRRFDRVIQERDRSGAEQILDDDYTLVLVQPTPAIMPRDRWLTVLDDYLVHSYAVEEQRIDETEGIAAVLTRVRMEATVLGQDRSGLFVISDIWRRHHDGWRVWRRHSTPLSAGSMPGASSQAP